MAKISAIYQTSKLINFSLWGMGVPKFFIPLLSLDGKQPKIKSFKLKRPFLFLKKNVMFFRISRTPSFDSEM